MGSVRNGWMKKDYGRMSADMIRQAAEAKENEQQIK